MTVDKPVRRRPATARLHDGVPSTEAAHPEPVEVARSTRNTTDLALYTFTAQRSAAEVIKAYSTSFSSATRLLAPQYRTGVTSIYALVRVADEIVDGVAAQAGLHPDEQLAQLDGLEAQTDQAMHTGFSTNLVVHAFAHTARRAGIRKDLTAPFFASMRADLHTTHYGKEDLGSYIYGSAEVVGLMCLRVFLAECPDRYDPAGRARLTEGARRLGCAFQKVNFLRDLSDDLTDRGRDYFDVRSTFSESTKTALVAEIDDDLAAAAAVIPQLPRGCRAAVTAAHDLFAALNQQLRRASAEELLVRRVRVPNRTKARILMAAIARQQNPGATRRGRR